MVYELIILKMFSICGMMSIIIELRFSVFLCGEIKEIYTSTCLKVSFSCLIYWSTDKVFNNTCFQKGEKSILLLQILGKMV